MSPRLDELPGVRHLRRIGASDVVLDAVLVTGFFLFLVIIVVGRDVVTVWVTVLYLLFVPAYLLYRYIRKQS